MPKFARAALLTMAMSAPVLAGAFMDHSVAPCWVLPATAAGAAAIVNAVTHDQA